MRKTVIAVALVFAGALAATAYAEVNESGVPLCNGEIFIPTQSMDTWLKLTSTSKQTRAEAIAMQLKTTCEESIVEFSGGSGRFNGRFQHQWDESTETMQTVCDVGTGMHGMRTINISFEKASGADFAKWRTVGANCSHVVTNDDEAALLNKFGPSKLD